MGAQHCPLGLHAPRGAACRGDSGGLSPGGAGLPRLRGVSGVRRCSSLSRPSFGAGCRGSAARVSWVRSVWAWRPGPGPTVCVLASCRCALRGWRKGVLGGGALCRCDGRLCSGVPLPPAARPLGGLSGFATHALWARVCGCGGPALSPWLACSAGGLCAARVVEGPSPGGVALHRWEGRLMSGAVPPPAARPLGRAAGVPCPVCPGCGWGKPGDPAPAPHRVSVRATVACCGGGGRASPAGVSAADARGV